MEFPNRLYQLMGRPMWLVRMRRSNVKRTAGGDSSPEIAQSQAGYLPAAYPAAESQLGGGNDREAPPPPDLAGGHPDALEYLLDLLMGSVEIGSIPASAGPADELDDRSRSCASIAADAEKTPATTG